MKIRLADYVADFFTGREITHCFSVVGGGAMHLNDAFGHKEGLECIYNHHEQACAIAAEAYARLNNKPALVCVTTGPGGTNAITGVVGGWLDSIPMIVVSGQVRYDTTSRYGEQFTEGLPLRAVGDQEFDIIKSVSCMCKYAVMLEDVNDIRYVLEKAWHMATTGRPGPVWIDIPVNFQGAMIETTELKEYHIEEDSSVPPSMSDEQINLILEKIKASERPVIYAGGGVRLSKGYEEFRTLVDKLGIPVVTYWNSIDLMEDEHPLYCGRGGNMGDRAGNFAVQNADLILAIGTRLSIRQVGYNWETWAREAHVIMVDIDKAELKKHTIHVETPIWADAKDFLIKMNQHLDNTVESFKGEWWREQCRTWKKKYPVATETHYQEKGQTANVYAAMREISSHLPEKSLTAVSNGACCVAGHQTWVIKKGTRFIINNAIASMGYGLPAAIGLCISGGKQSTVCMEGDGSIMMNLQELQTIISYELPVKIFLINNCGYHSIRITQNNLFSDKCKIGIGPDSKDLGFPNFKKIAEAFGFPYFSISSNKQMKTVLPDIINMKGYAFCEIYTDTQQVWEPKSGTKIHSDGKITSSPLEDLVPFLPREELLSNLYVTPLD